MKKILAFGYIPKQFGGKQTTGLATGIFDLHDSVNEQKTYYKVIIAATDIHKNEIQINNTTIIGWNKKTLVKHIIQYPLRFLYFIYRVSYLFSKFRKLVPFSTTLAKTIFLDYAIEKIKPDLVHFHGTSGALLSFCLWKKKQDSMLRLHGINGYNPSTPNYKLHRNIEKFITGFKFLRVTFVARGIQKEWKKKYGAFSCEMVSVLNGYNSKLFYPTINDINKKYDIITIAGLSENKGQMRVIEALIKLKQDSINLSYVIIGSDTKKLRERLNEIIANNNLNVTVIDYLPQEELNKYLNQTKYFILPSITEGFGKVFIESIGAGTAVIIPSHLPLAKEVGILNSINSYKLSSYDTESIYLGLKHLFKSSLKLATPDYVSSTVEKLQWSYIAIEYIELYKSIFNK